VELGRARAPAAAGNPAALPAVELWRTFIAEPASDELMRLAERRGWSRLRDGDRLLLLAGRDRVPGLADYGVRVTLLSVDSDAFTTLSEDTAAQRARDLAEWLPTDRARIAAERARLLRQLRLAQLPQKRQLAATGVAAAARQVAVDTAELLASLAPTTGAPPLATAHAAALADARLFARLARRGGFAALAAIFDDEERRLSADAPAGSG